MLGGGGGCAGDANGAVETALIAAAGDAESSSAAKTLPRAPNSPHSIRADGSTLAAGGERDGHR